MWKSWQSKVLTIQDSQSVSLLIDSIADIYVCNNKELMTNYYEKTTRIEVSRSNRILQYCDKVPLWLSFKDTGVKEVVLDFKNVYYLLSSSSNFVNLGLLNDYNIHHDNKNETLYDREIKEVLAHAKRWRNFLFQPFNLSDTAV